MFVHTKNKWGILKNIKKNGKVFTLYRTIPKTEKTHRPIV